MADLQQVSQALSNLGLTAEDFYQVSSRENREKLVLEAFTVKRSAQNEEIIDPALLCPGDAEMLNAITRKEISDLQSSKQFLLETLTAWTVLWVENNYCLVDHTTFNTNEVLSIAHTAKQKGTTASFKKTAQEIAQWVQPRTENAFVRDQTARIINSRKRNALTLLGHMQHDKCIASFARNDLNELDLRRISDGNLKLKDAALLKLLNPIKLASYLGMLALASFIAISMTTINNITALQHSTVSGTTLLGFALSMTASIASYGVLGVAGSMSHLLEWTNHPMTNLRRLYQDCDTTSKLLGEAFIQASILTFAALNLYLLANSVLPIASASLLNMTLQYQHVCCTVFSGILGLTYHHQINSELENDHFRLPKAENAPPPMVIDFLKSLKDKKSKSSYAFKFFGVAKAKYGHGDESISPGAQGGKRFERW